MNSYNYLLKITVWVFMFKNIIISITCFVISSSLCASPFEINKSKMINDLDLIKTIFEVKYAPAEWKKKFSGWDLNEEIQKAKHKILSQESLSISQYQGLLLDFFNSMQDYHVNIGFYATELSLLPFRLEGAQGRYFVAWKSVDDSLYTFDPQLSLMLSQMKVGDEVIAFDGMPIDQYVQNFRNEAFGPVGTGTDQRMAEQFLTLRLASRGNKAQEGPIEIQIKHSNGKISTYNPQWLYVPEEIQNSFSAIQTIVSNKTHRKKINHFSKKMETPLKEHLQKAKSSINEFFSINLDANDEDSSFMILGQYKSFVPTLGPVLWQSSGGMHHAYIFKTANGKKIGYVRIPTYGVTEEAYMEFETLIRHFQQETDALVIDQLNNPGGYALYLFSLLSMLSDKPLAMPLQRMTITQEDVSEALSVLKDPEYQLEELTSGVFGFSISQEDLPEVIHYFETIIHEWEAKHYFTDPLYFYGLSSVKPNPKASYSKPILVLVNEMDFSCADFFPAILQDNHRAKIFGTKTAGAGGFVLQHRYPNLFGIESFSYTGSIAYRMNDKPIENLGITPDIYYELTADDLTNGYKGYRKAVLDAINTLF